MKAKNVPSLADGWRMRRMKAKNVPWVGEWLVNAVNEGQKSAFVGE
jgi:hypothetical protein